MLNSFDALLPCTCSCALGLNRRRRMGSMQRLIGGKTAEDLKGSGTNLNHAVYKTVSPKEDSLFGDDHVRSRATLAE